MLSLNEYMAEVLGVSETLIEMRLYTDQYASCLAFMKDKYKEYLTDNND